MRHIILFVILACNISIVKAQEDNYIELKSNVNLNNYFRNINSNISSPIPNNVSDKVKYNLSGQKVNENYQGIIIEDGKKKLIKQE